jgi:hypothetical protein
MRYLLVAGLVFTLAAVPVAQAQQIATPVPAEQSVPSLVEVPQPRIQVDPAPAPEIQVRQEAVSTEAMREVSARTVLAVIGGALIVVALISLLR